LEGQYVIEAEKWYQFFVNTVQDYAFILFDTENRVTHWNVGAERILGWTEEEIVGQPGSVFFTPEDRKRGEVEKELATAQRDGKAEDERWHIRKDGSCFWASGIMTAVRQPDAELIGFAKVFRDLTERKQASEALRQSEEQLRLFQHSVRDYALFQVDTKGIIRGWNVGAQNLFDYAPQEIVGQPVAQLFTEEDRSATYPERELESALRHRRFEDERWMARKGGSRFWAHWVTHPIHDSQGEIRGFAKVLHDETKRKLAVDQRENAAEQERESLMYQVRSSATALDRTKEQLRALAARLIHAQEEERRRLARELHDDLSQGLALMEMQLQSLPQEAAQLGHASEPIAQLIRHCRALSDQVRSLSHALHPSILADLGLESALRNLIEDVDGTQGVAVRLSLTRVPSDLPLPVATALFRVTQESLRNVVKHAPGSEVTIRMWEAAGVLCLEITDTGPGFDPDCLAQGVGLGLISMQERIHLIGGSLQVRSRRGAGAVVSACVPWQTAARSGR
jgi:PAS domain S-box-containing protein